MRKPSRFFDPAREWGQGNQAIISSRYSRIEILTAVGMHKEKGALFPGWLKKAKTTGSHSEGFLMPDRRHDILPRNKNQFPSRHEKS